MIVFIFIVLFTNINSITSQTWNISDGILPWEAYVNLVNIQRPLGIILNASSLAHHHFAIGYLSFHSFMYDEAQNAFDLAIQTDPTFVEPYIGKMLACKSTIRNEIDFDCGLAAYNATQNMLTTHNISITSLQSALINTVYQWYANQSSVYAGEDAFLSSIANVSAIYSNETDIQVLWGLSLLNVAFQQRYDGQLEPEPMIHAREILKKVLSTEPNHPGALHYIIRCYDVAQIDIAAQAITYISTYQNLDLTFSDSQHVPAHIWLRVGEMVLTKIADDGAVRTSLTLCAIQQLRQNINISSSLLDDYLSQFNTSDQIASFLKCDDENRALFTEWLSNSRLQTGNWNGTIQTIIDLYRSYNLSSPAPLFYLKAAYRARARTLVSIFYWLPYDIQFINRAEQLNKLDDFISVVAIADNDTTNWDLAWSEAGYHLSECIRILTRNSTSYNNAGIKAIIDQHLNRITILANRTYSINQYVSTSISLMTSQIYGIINYKNSSYQECINVLNNATQREFALVIDNNSPTLLFARSSELLAVHLLLISRIYEQQSAQTETTKFMLNGTEVSVDDFPQYALDLYKQANLTAPNRATNILGIARSYSQLRQNNEAAKYYQMLINQITSTNTSDPIFSDEANNFIAQSTANNHRFFSLWYLITFFCLFFFH